MSMKRVLLASLVVLSLAACRRQPEEAPAESTENGSVNEAVSNLPEPDMNASLETMGAMHPDEADYRFAGRWAADERQCGTAAWRFTNSDLHAPGGAQCRFLDVRAVPGGYDVPARCTVNGEEQEDVLSLRFAESAGAMLFEAGTIDDTGLVPCEPPAPERNQAE
jgi:hypothetical protein